MSIQSAKALYSRLLSDEAFRRQLEQAVSHQQRYEILQAAGFSCTPAELQIAKNELLQSLQNNEELSEIEQECIRGGSSINSLLTRFDYFDYLLKEK